MGSLKYTGTTRWADHKLHALIDGQRTEHTGETGTHSSAAGESNAADSGALCSGRVLTSTGSGAHR